MSKYRDEQLLISPSSVPSLWVFVSRMGCLSSALMAVISDLVLFGLMLADKMRWAFWPYVVVPIGLWIVFMGLPVAYKSREVVMITLDAYVETARAWWVRAQRAQAEQVSVVRPALSPPKTEEIRVLPLRAGANTRVMPLDVPVVKRMSTQAPEVAEDVDVPGRRLWHCPGGVKVRQESLEEFVDGMFGAKGLSREQWVPGSMDRETYDGIVALLEQAQLVEGRKPGHSGKLTVRSSRQARMVLGLP